MVVGPCRRHCLRSLYPSSNIYSYLYSNAYTNFYFYAFTNPNRDAVAYPYT